MLSIGDQITIDADSYQSTISQKYEKFNLGRITPVLKDLGDDYNRGYRKYNGSPFVVKLSRQAIAYLYKQLYEETVKLGHVMAGDLAVSFANHNPDELTTPANPGHSDPNWNNEKAYQNTVMLGLWDAIKGIKPFKGTINGITIEYYDDWSQEWP